MGKYQHFKPEFFVGTQVLGIESSPFLVAEIGLNHNSDLEIGKRTIQAAKKAGASAVKFQSYITEEFIEPTNSESRFLFDIFKTYELDENAHRVFQETANSEGLIFFSTPLCLSSVDMLVSLKVPVLKIASGDIVNQQLLKKAADTGLPLFVSTGAAEFFEVVRAVDFLAEQQVKELSLMHCVSLYPTPPEELQLRVISLYLEMFPIPIGFSDHSAGDLASALAVGLGASHIEKHFTLDKTLPGPDHGISLDPSEFKQVAESIQKAYLMRGEKYKTPTAQERSGRFFGRRSMYAVGNSSLALRPAMHLKDPSFADSWNQKEQK
jgi:sialic acid synthase SpsE